MNRPGDTAERAVPHYRTALARDAKFSQAYEQLTRSLIALKDHAQAIDTLHSWVKADPRSVDARLWLAQLLDSEKRYQEVYDLLLTATRQLNDPRLSQALTVATERLKLLPSLVSPTP